MCVDGCKVQYWHSCIVESLSTIHAVLCVVVCVLLCKRMKPTNMHYQTSTDLLYDWLVGEDGRNFNCKINHHILLSKEDKLKVSRS